MSLSLCPTIDDAEFAVDLYCLLVAQVEELRKLAAPRLRTELQRTAFADQVAARARRLRLESPEGAPPMLAQSPRRPAEEPREAGRAQRDRLPPMSTFESTRLEANRRYQESKAKSDALMALIRGEATA